MAHFLQGTPTNGAHRATPGLKSLLSGAFSDVWNHFLSEIFDLEELWRATGTPAIRASLNNISDLVDARTKIIPIPRTSTAAPSATHQPERKGPPHVLLERASRVNVMDPTGRGLFSDDYLQVQNPSKTFITYPANVSVSRGKWQYEVLLLTDGLMQIGWMNPQLVFNPHAGVGDVFESFGFDGYRRKKWGEDMATGPYGSHWSPGDVLGCLLDLDNKVVTFTLNGVSMGEAWNEIPTGANTFYSPAGTLTEFQMIRFNFGSTPFRFPAQGYSPLEVQPPDRAPEVRLAPLLLKYYVSCLKRMLPHLVSGHFLTPGSRPVRNLDESLKLSETDGTVLLATLFEKMSPLFLNDYAVVESFVPFLLESADSARSSLAQLTDVVDTLCDPDECESLWTICLSELCQRATREAYPVLMSDEASIVRTGKEYREIAIYFLSNRRVLRHVYRSPKFPLFLEQIYHIYEPSRADLKLLFPHPWWPGSTEDFSSYTHMKRALDKLTDYNESLYRTLVGFTTALLSDTDPLDTPQSNPPILVNQTQLANMGRNSISNWIDFSRTKWNSPASVFLLWAGCWVQNRKPHLGELTTALDDQDDRVSGWTAESPRVLDSLFATLCRFISNCSNDGVTFLGVAQNFGAEIFSSRSPAFWRVSDCVGGDYRATRRELRLNLDPNSDELVAPKRDTILASVLRICVLLFPDRSMRLILDPVIEPTRARNRIATSLKQIKESVLKMKARKENTQNIEKLLEEARYLAVGCATRHASGIGGKYSPANVRAMLDFGALLVYVFREWIGSSEEFAREMFKLVPLDYLFSLGAFYQSIYPLTLQESLESTDLGSAMSTVATSTVAGKNSSPASVKDKFGQIVVDIVWALVFAAADLRVLNPQERSQLMDHLVTLVNKSENHGGDDDEVGGGFPVSKVLATREFVTALGRTLLAGFTKEQTAAAASRLLLQLWYDKEPLALSNAFLYHFGPQLHHDDDTVGAAFLEFLGTLIAKLNFNVTEMVKASGDVLDRQNLLSRTDPETSQQSWREISQNLLDATKRLEDHQNQTVDLLLLLGMALYLNPAPFLDRVRLSMICGPIQYLFDRITTPTSPFKKLTVFFTGENSGQELGASAVTSPLILMLNAMTEANENVKTLFISVISRDLSLKSRAFQELASLAQEIDERGGAPFSATLRDTLATLEKLALDRETSSSSLSSQALESDGAASQQEEKEERDEEELCSICYSEPVDTIFRPCNHTSCGICIRRQLTVKPTCFMCNQLVDSLEPLPKPQHLVE